MAIRNFFYYQSFETIENLFGNGLLPLECKIIPIGTNLNQASKMYGIWYIIGRYKISRREIHDPNRILCKSTNVCKMVKHSIFTDLGTQQRFTVTNTVYFTKLHSIGIH